MFGGTIRIFLAEALLLPTGIVTAAFLTRHLGPEGYGLYTLAATIIAWLSWSSTSILSNTTIKFVGEAQDWRQVGTVVLRLYLLVGVGAMLLVWLFAHPVANLMSESAMTSYLLIFALDLPFFCLASAHSNILIGIAGFNQRAIATAGRWISRLILIVILVQLGFEVTGAILGSVGASLVELLICRFYIRPNPFANSTFPPRQLWSYAVPLFFYALTMRLYEKLDLFALKILGGSAAEAGFYGAAQNLSLIPGIFSLAFAPLLLSSLTQSLHAGDRDKAKKMVSDGMRAVLLMLPFGGLMAGAAPEIVRLIFGDSFLPAAPLLSLLIFGAIGISMISINSAILTATGKPNWTIALTGPLLPLTCIAYWLLIPRLGTIGASIGFTLFATIGALATIIAVFRLWRVLPPSPTIWRAALVSTIALFLAAYWSTQGFWLLLKLFAIAVGILVLFLLLGEFSQQEIALVRSLIPRSKTT